MSAHLINKPKNNKDKLTHFPVKTTQLQPEKWCPPKQICLPSYLHKEKQISSVHKLGVVLIFVT